MNKVSEIISFETLLSDSSKGWPTLDDLKKGRVFMDKELYPYIKDIENIFRKKNCCLIRGAEGRGKTVLARVVAYNYYKERWKIRFIDVSQIKEEDAENILAQAERAVKGNQKTLLIVENAHFSLDKIIPELLKLANDYSGALFIFTSREIFPEEEQLLDPFEDLKEKGLYVDLKPGLEEACHIIETFISAEKINYLLIDQDKSWITKEFGKEAINLRRLKWYLETWKEKGGGLSSVKKKEVLSKALKHYFSELGGNVNLEEMLYRVTGIFQFDVNFYGGGYDKTALRELKEKGIITSIGGDFYGDYYRLQHSSDAVYIIEALADKKKKNPEDITINILKEYLQKRPVNYLELMRALYRGNKKNILSIILEDYEIYEVIFNMVKQDRIRMVASVLGYLTWACGRERGKEFWSQYKISLGISQTEQKEKLKVKLTEAFLIEVEFLLLFLSRVDVNEKDWLANEVLDEDILSKQSEDAKLSTITYLIKLLPENKALAFTQKLNPSNIAEKTKVESLIFIHDLLRFLSDEKTTAIISKLDPAVIAEKAKSVRDQVIMWILKYCLRDSSNIKFANSFLSAINKDLIEKLKDSELRTVLESLRIIKLINSDLYKKMRDSLSPYWRQIWLSSGLSTIANQLYKYRSSVGESREFVRSIVKNLASIELSEPIKKLYSQPEAKVLKGLGKLLASTYQIASETDKNAVEKIAEQIVKNINLRVQERYTIEQLSLLVNNVKKCNELAWRQLCSKILSELKLTDYISIPFDKGLAVLIWHIYQNNEENGQELANKIFSLDFDKLLDSSETLTISYLLWNLLQINEIKVKSWIQNIEEGKWLSKALSSSTHDMFWLLWSLYHADEEKGRSLTRLLADNILSTLTTVEVMDLPLLGFFLFCGIQFDLKLYSIPSPHEIAEKISEDLSLVGVAFCMFVLREKNDKLLKEFSKELGRCLFLRTLEFSINEIIKKHPFENTRKSLTEIFKDFDLPNEPDSTFAEMICLTKAYLNEKGKAKAAFSQLRDYFLKNPINNPLFKTVEAATKWLNIAIEYEIYHEKQVPHYKYPSGIVKLLSLNKDNRIVSLHLKENEI